MDAWTSTAPHASVAFDFLMPLRATRRHPRGQRMRTPTKAAAAKGRGLRAHLAALVLAVLLPAFTVGAATAWRMAGNYRAAFEERLSATAQALALALGREVQAHPPRSPPSSPRRTSTRGRRHPRCGSRVGVPGHAAESDYGRK